MENGNGSIFLVSITFGFFKNIWRSAETNMHVQVRINRKVKMISTKTKINVILWRRSTAPQLQPTLHKSLELVGLYMRYLSFIFGKPCPPVLVSTLL